MNKVKRNWFIAIGVVMALVIILRFMVFDIVKVSPQSRCPNTAHISLVNRWSYGYHFPWNGKGRVGYETAKRNDWITYHQPALQRGDDEAEGPIFVGQVMAAAGDTLWYDNESGQIARDRNKHNRHLLIVPKKRLTVSITNDNIRFYALTIMQHEPVKANVVDGQLCVSGQMVKSYTFTQDYYWIVSDEADNPADSGAWGFVPHASLIGKII